VPGVTSSDRWDPGQYNKFAAEREQPFWDLVRLIEPVDGPRVVDLGCGDGRLTAALATELGAVTTIGIDSSPAMVAAATEHSTETVRFETGDIGRWERPDAYDVVLANASMQWVGDHPAVLGRWTRSLRPGGQLAVQVPANADHIAHRLADELAHQWMDHPPPDPVAENVLAPEQYAVLLDQLGFDQQQVRLQVYAHHLATTADVVEWVKGTTLTRFKEPLGPDQWPRFVEAYRQRFLEIEGDRSPYFYPFKRILLWGRQAG
jgi:trans-aconitate 2-methyltransferase